MSWPSENFHALPSYLTWRNRRQFSRQQKKYLFVGYVTTVLRGVSPLDFSSLVSLNFRQMADGKHSALRSEQDKQQTRSFLKWWNTHLALHKDGSVQMEDLFEDVQPGILPIKLLECLSSSSCGRYSKKPISKFQKLENANIFLNQLKARSIKLVNIGAEDLVSGDKKLILGLTWTLILRYEIHEFGVAEKDLFGWVQQLVREKGGGSDFTLRARACGDAFADGQVFCRIVHDAVPEAIDLEATAKMAPEPALATAFEAATVHLGVPALLEPTDFTGPHQVGSRKAHR